MDRTRIGAVAGVVANVLIGLAAQFSGYSNPWLAGWLGACAVGCLIVAIRPEWIQHEVPTPRLRSPITFVWPGRVSSQVQLFRYVERAADERVARVQGDCERLLADKNEESANLRGQIAYWKTKADEEEVRARRFFQQLRYGRVLIDESIASNHDFAAMRSSLQELKPSLDRLATASDRVWNGMLAMAQDLDSESTLAWLLWCFRQFPSAYGVHAMRAFLEFVDSDRDPRPLLAAAYIGYVNWREWVLRLVTMLGRRPDELPAYVDWIEAEKEFTSLLERKLETSLMHAVREEVREFRTGAGRLMFPPPMPVVLPGASLTPPPPEPPGQDDARPAS